MTPSHFLAWAPLTLAFLNGPNQKETLGPMVPPRKRAAGVGIHPVPHQWDNGLEGKILVHALKVAKTQSEDVRLAE